MANENLNHSIYRVGRFQIRRDRNESGDWLFRVPQHVITQLNRSTDLKYGTSFDNCSDVTCWVVGSGTWAGVAGTTIGIFFGTGLNG